MIYSISGVLKYKREGFIVIEQGGVGYKIFVSPRTLHQLPPVNKEVLLFIYPAIKEDAFDLYGFLNEADLNLFEKLVSISGIGPKSALAVMATASAEKLTAAISEGKTDLLTRVSGIGQRTAERVIIELKNKLPAVGDSGIIESMEVDNELEEALTGLGYSKTEARKVISRLQSKSKRLEDRLKEALRIIKE